MPEDDRRNDVVLLVDDEPDLLESCVRILEDERCDCVTATDGVEALDLARKAQPDIVVTDFQMPGKSGVDLLRAIREEFPAVPVVMISAYTTIEGVVEAVKMGAFDYLTKPFSSDQFLITIRRALDQSRLKRENETLKKKVRDDFFTNQFVGKHPKFLRIVELTRKVAGAESCVLIQGETGTGKDLVARAVHLHSKRAEKPFVVVDCETLTPEMLEAAPLVDSETNERPRKSVFEAAHGGTLYLKKVDELNPGLQTRLLRILQDRMAPRRGEWEWAPVNVRVISSTTADLREAVNERRFRENLFYLLNVVNIHIPPLRDRKEDIGILCDHFLRQKAEKENAPVKTLHHDSLARLMEYEWPGNVWELRSVIEMAASIADGDAVAPKDIPDHVRPSPSLGGPTFKEAKKRWMERFEKDYLENLLLISKGNISRASEEAGIARMSLYRMLKRNGLTQFAVHKRSARKNRTSSSGRRNGKGGREE